MKGGCLHLDVLRKMKLIPPSDGCGLHIVAQGCRERRHCIVCIHHRKRWRLCQESRGSSRKKERSKAHALDDPMSQWIMFWALCHSNHCIWNSVLITTTAPLWPLISGCSFILWNCVTFCCSTEGNVSIANCITGYHFPPFFLLNLIQQDASSIKTCTSLEDNWNKQWTVLSSQFPSSSYSEQAKLEGHF